MKLQLAMDRYSIDEAIDTLKTVHDLVDIIEIGTPMLLRFGFSAVTRVKEAYPQKTILCDAKIMDGGKFEADCGFEAGADITTVMGLANDKTITDTIKSAKNYGKKVMVDMMNVAEPEKAAARFDGWGADYICIHNASDVLDMDRTLDILAQSAHAIPGGKLVIAGGINPSTILQLKRFNPAVMVVGHAIVTAHDKRLVIQALRDAYQA